MQILFKHCSKQRLSYVLKYLFSQDKNYIIRKQIFLSKVI